MSSVYFQVTPGYEDACRSRVTKICKEFEADSKGGVEVRATIDLELQARFWRHYSSVLNNRPGS